MARVCAQMGDNQITLNMRKLFFLWTSVAVLAMAASCTLNKLEETPMPGSEGTQVTFTATAADSGSGTKALLVDGAPDIYWAPGDGILIFNRSWGTSEFHSTNTERARVVSFSGSVSGYAGAVSPENQVWAAYPASWDHIWFDYQGGKYVEMSLPFTQTAVAGTFDPKALMMLARSADTNLGFYHVGGGLKFKLTQDWVKQVELRANDGSPLAGYVQVVMDGQGLPTVSEYYETTDVVRLTAPKGETLQPGVWYYLCCLPAVLEKGYTLTFRSETQTGTVNHTSPAEVKRATWGVLEAADGGVVPMIAENDLYGDTIYYTSTDGIVQPNNEWGFGANIVSNTCENGQGVIQFDGPVTGIPNFAFSYRQTLQSIKLPSTVWGIGGWAFNGCSSLQSVVLREGLAIIEDCAFQDCNSLTEIEIPGRLQEISPNAFNNCNNLSKFLGPLATSDEHGLVLDGTLVVFARGWMGDDVVDYEVEAGITGLGDRIFNNVWRFRDVTLPESLETIGEQAFAYCSNLRAFHGKFASEDGHLLVKDGEILATALYGVNEFTVPETVKTISSYAFTNKWGLETVIISDGVESIGDYAFQDCGNLRDVTLPESLKSLGRKVFLYDQGIQKFHGKYASADEKFLIDDTGCLLAAALGGVKRCIVPEGVTAIGEAVFFNAYALTEIVLPQSLRKIGSEAFACCQNEAFTSFTIPSGVTEIGHDILNWSSNLKEITLLPTSVPKYDTDWSYPLGNGLQNARIFVPKDLLESYRSAEGWRYQSNYEVIPEYPAGSNEQMGENDWD